MPQGSDYIFALQDSDFNFWRIKANGMVDIGARPYLLDFAPGGWPDISIQNERNKRLWGVDRHVTIPLAYLMDAAKILKHIVYTRGLETKVFLVIGRQEVVYNPNVSYGYWYKQIYRAQVDLAEFLHSGAEVKCTTLEDGLPKYLKSNMQTKFDLPMNVPEAVMVKMDGIRLHEQLNYEPISGFDINASIYSTRFLVPSTFINAEGDHTGIQVNSQQIQYTGGMSWDDSLALDNCLIRNVGDVPVTVTVEGTMAFTCTSKTASAASIRFRFTRSTQPSSTQDLYQVAPPVSINVGDTFNQPFSFSIPLQVNEKLFLESIFLMTGTETIVQFTNACKFNIKFITRYRETYVPHFTAQYIFDQLIPKVTEMQYQAAISAYFTQWRQKKFTCGNAIRGLADATMKISLEDLFQDFDCFDSVGIYDDAGKVNFNSKKNMVDRNNVIHLPAPAVGSFKVSVAKEYMFNEYEHGYAEIKNDVGVLNGNEEFNTKYLHSFGASAVTAKLDKVSKISSQCYPQERLRIATFAKDTTDNKSDNDLFSNYTEDTLQPAAGDAPAHYLLDRSLNGLVTQGLLEPATVWNLALSPKRNMKRNGPFIRSCSWLSDYKTLGYRTVDKNNKVVCDGLIEKADENNGLLGDQFFVPMRANGEFPAPDNIEELLEINPLQVFDWPIDGITYTGILERVGIAPSSKKSQDYQFLFTPDNDLSKLEDYYG